ncbi:MAG: ComEC/Rec2 family competence protein [Muribaculaceae bacterium]|nr:ComEC/Rec2 family competence protein [Muribaculaceae bacterium]
MKYPFLLIALSTAAGILPAAAMSLPFSAGMAAVLFSLVVWLISTYLLPGKIPIRCGDIIRMVCVVTLFGGLGMTVSALHEPSDRNLADARVPVRAIVTDVETLASGDRIIAETEGQKFIARCKAARVVPGDIADFPPRFRRIGSNPNLYQEEYASRMEKLGFKYEIDVSGDELNPAGHSPLPQFRARKMRDELARLIDSTPLAPDTRDLLITLFLGEKHLIDASTRKIFSDAGISHLLALSGMHIAIVATIILLLLFPFNFAGKWRWRYAAAVVILWIYTFLTGMAPSTVRASLMATFLFAGIILQRRGNAFNSLCAAAFVIMLFSPDSLTDLGAQLSFLSVAALIIFAGPLNSIDHRRNPRLYAAAGAVLTSMVAFAASWPLMSHHFGRLPLLFLPVNLLVLPLLPFYMGVALVYFLCCASGWESVVLGNILDSGCRGLLDVAQWISGGGRAVLETEVPFSGVLVWIAALVFLGVYVLSGFNRKSRGWLYAGVAAAAGSVALSLYPFEKETPHGYILQNNLTGIHILAIEGQRQSRMVMPRRKFSYIEHCGKRIAAIDSGIIPSGDPEADISDGKTFDYLIVASGFGGSMADLISYIPVDTVVIHPSVRKKRELELMRECKERGVPVHSLRREGPLRRIGMVRHR